MSICKDGLPLEDDPRHIISADRLGSCCLILDSLTAQDAGQYTCYASSFMGSAATLAKVVVQGESCFYTEKVSCVCLVLLFKYFDIKNIFFVFPDQLRPDL